MSVPRVKMKHVAGSGQYGLNFPASGYVHAGVRLIRTTDLASGRLDPQGDGVFVPEEAVTAQDRLQPGDLLLSRSGTIGRAFLAPEETASMAFAGFLVRFRPGPEVVGRYLYYCTQSAEFQSAVQRDALSSTIQNFNAEKYNNLDVPVPSIAVQRAIVEYLDRETARIDALIEEQQRLIGMLRERRAAVLTTALAPCDSWLRRRIKHIGHTQLGKMLDGGRAARMGDELKSYVRAADVRADGSVNLVDLKQMPFSTAELEVFDLRAGDVLLIEGGATVGRPGFMFESSPGVAFQKTVNRLRVGPTADARFVYWSMLRLYESNYYANHYGAVSFVHLTGEKLREIELDLPSIDEQRRIAAYLDEQTAKIDALIAETERFVELSRERRSALITAAVTGQIDVSDEVA